MRSTYTQGTLKFSTCLHTTAQSLQTRKLKYFKVCTHHITITTMSHRWGTLKFQSLYTPQQRVYTTIHKGAMKKNVYVPQCRDHTHTRGTLTFFKVFTHHSTHTQGDYFLPQEISHKKKKQSVGARRFWKKFLTLILSEKNNLSSIGILTAPY